MDNYNVVMVVIKRNKLVLQYAGHSIKKNKDF